jgi:peptidyl-prolyl cis-trans isomerase SurA
MLLWTPAARALGLLFVILQVVATAPPAAAQTAPVQRIAAVVNDQIVSLRELSRRVELAIFASGLPDSDESRRRVAPQVLRALVDERLQLQEAERLGIRATEEEIDAAYADVARRNNLTPEQLSMLLGSRGIEPQIIRDQLRAQVAWLKVVQSRLQSRVVVTRDQVDLELKAARSGAEEVLLSEILLPIYEPEDERAVMQQAADLMRSLQGGTAFSELAGALSAAPSAEAGGRIGWVRLGAIAPELQGLISRLQVGQVSAPIRTPAGVQLLRVDDRRTVGAEPEGPATEEERETVRRQLMNEQLQRLATRHLRDLRRAAFIDVRL